MDYIAREESPARTVPVPHYTSRDAAGFALVLGGGGWPAHAYFAGVFAAFAEAGVELGAARSFYGTSAGALSAALLASGVAAGAVADVAEGWGASAGAKPFERAWHGRRDLAARLNGNRMLMRALLPSGRRRGASPRLIGQPMGLYRTREPGRYFGMLPTDWPQQPVALVSYDALRGRREVVTRDSSLELSFHEAIAASMAVPALVEPVRSSRHVFVDGGSRVRPTWTRSRARQPPLSSASRRCLRHLAATQWDSSCYT